ncbi:DUF1343 domain-containing protein [Flavobacteriaceae bacterium]|nr:DUF1343 domain-containing protein [Flavobacteriaceae bacterium]
MIWHVWTKNTLKIVLTLGLLMPFSCKSQGDQSPLQPIPAAQNMGRYLPLLQGKQIGLVANQTSVVKNSTIETESFTHLADTLRSLGISLKKVFAPEHGFRGTADAGAHISNGVDQKTGLEVISLYGANKKPRVEDLADIDLMIFDIQDVGVRFYTYISTLHYVMEACAEQNIPLIVLDRPNPNAHYIDGPVLKDDFKSFVGMHPVPVVYGMTIGEYAKMINGESWLQGQIKTDLTVISVENYTHDTPYALPIAPSPNLRSKQAIALYPSLCFFEGTPISAGRGTDRPFEIFGAPNLNVERYPFEFRPVARQGAKWAKFKDELCHGLDLGQITPEEHLELGWLIDTYNEAADKENFFNPFFDKLAGTDQLKKDIQAGLTKEEIYARWTKELEDFEQIRAKYLLYTD